MAEDKVNAAAVAKLVKVLGVGRELHGKLGEILDELDALLGGKPGIAAALKEFEGIYDALWCERYAKGEHGRYVWRYVQDRPHTKRLLKTLGLEELSRRADVYLRSNDPFYLKARHPFGLFVSSINSHAAPSSTPDLELSAPPADCRHVPLCASDQEHTRRRSAEMRA